MCDDAWQAWATAQRASLTVDPILVHGLRGQQVTDKFKDISARSVKPKFTGEHLLFKLWLEQAQDLIAQLQSPTTPEDVIARIEAAGVR